jgi:hypothetical protein
MIILTKLGSQYTKVDGSNSTSYFSRKDLERDIRSLDFFKRFPEKTAKIADVMAELESEGSCLLEAVLCSQ